MCTGSWHVYSILTCVQHLDMRTGSSHVYRIFACTGFWHVCLFRILVCLQDSWFTLTLFLWIAQGKWIQYWRKVSWSSISTHRTESCYCAVVTQKVHTSRTQLDYIEGFLAVRLKSAFLGNLWSESHFPCLWQKGNLVLHWWYLWPRLSAYQSPPGSYYSQVPLYISKPSRCCRPRGEWRALPWLFSRNFFPFPILIKIDLIRHVQGI